MSGTITDEVLILEASEWANNLARECNRCFNSGDQGSAIILRQQSDLLRLMMGRMSPSPSPSPVVGVSDALDIIDPIEVTDAMVEAARGAYREAWEDVRNTGHEAMRAALVAALRVR